MPFHRLRCAGLLAALAGLAATAQAGASHEGTAPAASAPAPEARLPARELPQFTLPDLRRRIDERLAAVRAQAASEPPPAAKPAVAAAAAARAPLHNRAATPAAAAAPHWSYDGEGGPQRWAALQPGYASCASGKRQSPIDIKDGIAVELEPVGFDYQPSAFRVIDDGHTVQVNLAPGNHITVGGRRYELLQFHFHRPSEERINGRQHDMVAHLVHKSADGRLAIVAVLLDAGRAHPLVQMVWNNLPLERGEEQAAPLPMDPSALLPEDRRYYTYMGSLTTPPCTEGVLWLVMKQPAALSPEQLAIFTRLYPMNARPLQAGGGRLIKESN